MRITYWLSILLFFTNYGCERPIPFPEQASSNVLVVNSFFTTDSIWQVHLSESSPIDSMVIFSTVLDGQVNIQDLTTNQTIQLNHQGNGLYTASTLLPQLNHVYQLMATANELAPIQVKSAIPTAFQVQLNQVQATTYQNQVNYLFDLTIMDNPNEANFYLIDVQYLLETPTQILLEKATHFSFDPNSDNETIVLNHLNLKRSYLSDENFNGLNYRTQIGANSTLITTRNNIDQLKAILTVRSITKSGYLYFKSVERFENEREAIFAEPIGVFSNIDDGLGIFAGYTEQRLEVILE